MASIYNGTVSHENWENLKRPQPQDDGINVGATERIVSGVAAAVVAAVGVRRKRLRPVLFPVAGSLMTRAFTGRCAVNRALGRRTRPKATGGAGLPVSPEAKASRWRRASW